MSETFSPERQAQQVESETKKQVERLEQNPAFQRIAGVLEVFQELCQAAATEEERETYQDRLLNVYLVDGLIDQESDDFAKIDPFIDVEYDVVNEMIAAAIEDRFSVHYFAQTMIECCEPEHLELLFQALERNKENDGKNIWAGEVLIMEEREEKGQHIVELHVPFQQESSGLAMMRGMRDDVTDLRQLFQDDPDLADVDSVEMMSWLLSERTKPMLAKIFGSKIAEQLQRIDYNPDFLTEDSINDSPMEHKIRSILSTAISCNNKMARDWLAHGNLPEVGKISVSREEFLEAA